MMRDINEVIKAALDGLPCPASREPAAGDYEQYVTWYELISTPQRYASNEARKVMHLAQVSIYSRPHYGLLLLAVISALRRAGLYVDGWGPEAYEEDTGYHHMPITIRWAQDFKEDDYG